jgi:hypothetical protein
MMALFLVPAMASAAPIVNLTFDLPVQTVEQGGTLTFAATLSVTGDPDVIFLAGDSIDPSPGFGIVGFDSPSAELLMLDDTPFFMTFPFQISSDDSGNPWHFDFFTVDVGLLAAPGTYQGIFYLLGGDVPDAQDIVASANFQVDVAAAPAPAPVPEPATLVLLSTGVATLGIRRRLRRPKHLSA